MDFPIADVFSIRYFLLAGAQTCQLFVNYLMATHNRSKETNSGFIGSNLTDLLSLLISNAIQLKGR